MSELQDLLSQAREADPADRIVLRDPIAAHGELAIDAMTDWLADPRLAAFAIRVLAQIGRESAHRSAVVAVLAAVDRSELPPHLTADVAGALTTLGVATRRGARQGGRTTSRARRPAGTPGARLRGEESTERRGEPWTEADYETLFGRFPPDGDRPSDGYVEALSTELGRTPDAISWQWGDGAAYRRGGSASTTSEPLKTWLDRQGLGQTGARRGGSL
jgi:hypothetical protein